MRNTNRADPPPCTSDPKVGEDGRRPELRVICKRRDTIRELRFLVSKLSYEEEGLTAPEVSILMELTLRTDRMIQKDFNFRRWILPLQEIKNLISGLRPGESRRNGLRQKFLALGTAGIYLILSPFEYFGMKGQERPGVARIEWSLPRLRRFPPKPYIGVGYKDKGNLRNKCHDGTPSWQEVASDERNRTGDDGTTTEWSIASDSPQGIFFWRPSGPRMTAKDWKVKSVTGHTDIIYI